MLELLSGHEGGGFEERLHIYDIHLARRHFREKIEGNARIGRADTISVACGHGGWQHAATQGRIDLARPWVDKLRVLENVVRAFPALLLGQNFGKMMEREARQA